MQHIYPISYTLDGGFGEKDSYLVLVHLKLQSLETVVLLQLGVRFSNRKSITSFFIVFHLLAPTVQFIIVILALSSRVFCYFFILVSSMYLLFSTVFIWMLYLFFPQSHQGRCRRETNAGCIGALHWRYFSKPGNNLCYYVWLQMVVYFIQARV